jgi:hypothetical protein
VHEARDGASGCSVYCSLVNRKRCPYGRLPDVQCTRSDAVADPGSKRQVERARTSPPPIRQRTPLSKRRGISRVSTSACSQSFVNSRGCWRHDCRQQGEHAAQGLLRHLAELARPYPQTCSALLIFQMTCWRKRNGPSSQVTRRLQGSSRRRTSCSSWGT